MTAAKKKTYLAVMILAILGFVVDRIIIGDPRSASAKLSSSDPMSIEQSSDAHTDTTNYEMPIPFPSNLLPMDWSRPMHNPFLLPPHIAHLRQQRLAGERTNASNSALRSRDKPLSVAQFIRVHHLSGVFVSGSGTAIIDGQVVRVGDKFDGSVLLKVEGHKAYFQCSDGQARLIIGGRD